MSFKRPFEHKKSAAERRQGFPGMMNTTDSTNTNSSAVFQSQDQRNLLAHFDGRNNQSTDFMKFIMQSKEGQNASSMLAGKMNKNEGSKNRNGSLDSKDFNAFLQNNLPQWKDSPNGFASLFKSKEAIDFSLSKSIESRTGKSLSKDSGDQKPKATINAYPTNTAAAAAAAAAAPSRYHSQDWMTLNTLGQHVDVPISTGIFAPPATAIRTDFSTSSMMFGRKKTPVESTEDTKTGSATNSKKTKKKRNRAPRKKIIPENKKYAEPTDSDVLMGRGGKSNHHPGNVRYRAEIDKFQGRYKATDDKDEKARISGELVSTVQGNGGNFLEKDDIGWYIIEDVVARRKVSQALREDKDPEKRKAKRQRFLEKKAAKEQNNQWREK